MCVCVCVCVCVCEGRESERSNVTDQNVIPPQGTEEVT